ncbi:hypothetical protein CTAYLR_003303 [Chrysophaeum taylorii]|uniref:G-patch domain-containing protein n=1 Tax=Chrysophaeum taylorii TaxID=2483200 RepID=A0AAD7UGD2_9STRA|nr:hypothetical protein CTAYLR_003303 [Chrysophaeum taylorii]
MSYSPFAHKAMAAMGWQEGKGLGKKEDGIAKFVGVEKKPDNAGLGAAITAKGSAKASFDEGQWWASAFGDALTKVNKRKAPTPSLDDLFEATGGARLGMRARSDQAGYHSSCVAATIGGVFRSGS